MKLILTILSILLILFLLYALSVRGRRNHPALTALRGYCYAHRGLHGGGVPENSLPAFQMARDAGYGIELDVHLLSDGGLGVMHDSLLARTTGQPGKIEDLTTAGLKNYRLGDTDAPIPAFSEVLDLYAGRAPLIIELKSDGDNYARLAETVCRALDGYSGAYCIESFDPRCIYWLRRNRPDIVRGQLSENFLRSRVQQPWLLRWCVTENAFHFLTRPDFIAYKFQDRRRLGNFLCRRLWGIQGVSWTLRTPAEFDTAVQEGWIPIFEGFLPSAEQPLMKSTRTERIK